MSAIILTYRLKEGVSPADFEAWVKETDQPAMRGLERVKAFDTFRITGPLMGEGVPSVHYVELFHVPDLPGFLGEDMGGAVVQEIMGQFMGFADAPEFMVAEKL